MAEKVVCKDPEFLCNEVVWVIDAVGQAVAGYEKMCSSNTRPMIFAPTPGGEDAKIEILRKKLKEKLAELEGSGA